MKTLPVLPRARQLSGLLIATVLSWPLVVASQTNVQLQISHDEDVIRVDWTPLRGVLQSASSVTGSWMNVSVENPSWFTGGSNGFFRVLDAETTNTIVLDVGADLYQSMGIGQVNLPADFFAPGSQPFSGIIQFRGEPLGTGGPFELGTTDTVVRRSDRVFLPPDPSTTTVPIELVSLSLVSVNPIQVNYTSGPPQQFQVFLHAGTLASSNSAGTMTIQRSTNGGTFEAQLPVQPILVFSNLTTLRSNTLPIQQMAGSNGTFSTSGSCATDALRVPRLPLGLCMESIQLEGSQLHLFLTAPSAALTQPGPIIMPGAMVDPGAASLGRYATISGGASIGPQAVIGPSAFIGSNVVVGSNVLIGENAVIEAGSVIGNNSIISGGTHLGTNSIVGSNVVVGVGCQFGHQVQIGHNSRVGDQSTVGDSVQIGDNVVCERQVTIGAASTLANGLFLYHGAQVAASVTLNQSLLLCALSNGSRVITNSAACESQNGAVLGLLSAEDRFLRTLPTATKKVTPLTWNPTNPPAGLTNLQNDVNNAGSATTNGPIKDRTWTTNTYDCDDFARDLEEALQALGYNATFTVYWHVIENPDYSWWNSLWTPKYIVEAHALTDVHTAEGLIWIEPQTGEIGVDLDFNGDGKVGYDTKHPGKFTDDDGRIEVYDSRAAAEAAGVVMD